MWRIDVDVVTSIIKENLEDRVKEIIKLLVGKSLYIFDSSTKFMYKSHELMRQQRLEICPL